MIPLQKIILDTNFLITAIKFRINLSYTFFDRFSHRYEIILLESVKKEFEILISRGIKEAKLALAIGEKFAKFIAVEGIDENLEVDDVLINYAIEHDGIIATNDKSLKKKAKIARIKVITIKNKSIISFDR